MATLYFAERAARERPPQLVRIVDPDHPCGPVAVAMASLLLKHPLGLDVATEEIDTDPRGRCSMQQLASCLDEHGFVADGVHTDSEMIRRLSDSTVMILYVDNSHFIVAKSHGNETVAIFDPPRRVLLTTLEEMPYRWNGEALIITHKDAQ